MQMFMQTIVSGLAIGSLYALAALGIVLLFNTTGIINFAQGEVGMVSTFVAFYCMNHLGLHYVAALLIALIFAIVLGIVVERALMRPVRKADQLTQINVTLGLFMVLNGTAGVLWGYDSSVFPRAWEGAPFAVFQVVFDRQSILVLAVAAAISLILFMLFKFTLLGIGMRAVSQDMIATKLMGVNNNRLFSAGWAIAALLGALAGLFIAPTTFLDPNMMQEVLFKAFAAAILGGFTSMPGAVLGGLLLGASENLIASYISTDLKSTFSFSLIVIILLIKPYGLLGRAEWKKV